MFGFPALCLRQLSGLLCGLLLNEKTVKVCLFFHDFELNSTEMFFGAAVFAPFDIGEACRNHVVVILILQNAVRFFENDFPAFSVHRFAGFIENGLRLPFFTMADLHHGFFDCANELEVFAAL